MHKSWLVSTLSEDQQLSRNYLQRNPVNSWSSHDIFLLFNTILCAQIVPCIRAAATVNEWSPSHDVSMGQR